jgi:hypothetical protein
MTFGILACVQVDVVVVAKRNLADIEAIAAKNSYWEQPVRYRSMCAPYTMMGLFSSSMHLVRLCVVG